MKNCFVEKSIEIELAEDGEICYPAMHDATIIGHIFSYEDRKITLQIKTTEGKEIKVVIYDVEKLRVEIWEALIIRAFYIFNINNFPKDCFYLKPALNLLLGAKEYDKNLSYLKKHYQYSKLFYIESNYGGELAFTGEKIEISFIKDNNSTN